MHEDAGGEQHNITEAAPNEVLATVGKVMKADHRLGGGVGACSQGRTNGRTTRRGIRAVEFQPDLKTIHSGSKI